MSEKVLIENGHHHPDYMRDAATLITHKRKIKRSKLGRRAAQKPYAASTFLQFGRCTARALNEQGKAEIYAH